MNPFQRIIDTLSNAFSILDFSYTVSGGATLAVILFDWYYVHNNNIDCLLKHGWILALVCGILSVYLLGILSCSIGKVVRQKAFARVMGMSDFKSIYDDTIKAIRKDDENATFFLEKSPSLSYEGMWIELEQIEETAQRLKFIHRFWVMQAVYEGLVATWILGIFVSIDWWNTENDANFFKLILAFVVLAILIWRCCKEAQTCAETQIKEIILSYYIYTKK